MIGILRLVGLVSTGKGQVSVPLYVNWPWQPLFTTFGVKEIPGFLLRSFALLLMLLLLSLQMLGEGFALGGKFLTQEPMLLFVTTGICLLRFFVGPGVEAFG